MVIPARAACRGPMLQGACERPQLEADSRQGGSPALFALVCSSCCSDEMELKLFQFGFVSWEKNCGRRGNLSPRRAQPCGHIPPFSQA